MQGEAPSGPRALPAAPPQEAPATHGTICVCAACARARACEGVGQGMTCMLLSCCSSFCCWFIESRRSYLTAPNRIDRSVDSACRVSCATHSTVEAVSHSPRPRTIHRHRNRAELRGCVSCVRCFICGTVGLGFPRGFSPFPFFR